MPEDSRKKSNRRPAVIVICKITYLNGKIFIGKDLSNTLNYFGSSNTKVIEADFCREEKRDFTLRKQIIWESDSASDREVNDKEVELIRAYQANNPIVGYNRWPPF